METEIIVALIAAFAAIIAAVIASKLGGKTDPTTKIEQNTSGSSNAYAAGRDIHVQHNHKIRFLNEVANKLVTDSSYKHLGDTAERWEWASFDAQFLSKSIKDSPRGWMFDGYAVDELRLPENKKHIMNSGKIYILAALNCESEESEEYKALNKLAQLYYAESQLDKYSSNK